jgi:hypothetical protein
MNWLKRWIIEREGKIMLGKLFTKMDGYKTYALAVLGIVVGLVGHFWGPISWGPIQIPALSWDDFWKILWNGGLFAFLRQGVTKSGPVTPA